jgi:molybdopterin synthase sulfur carrier subunit
MPVQVQIPSQFRSLTGGAAEVSVEAQDVAGLIEALGSRHAGLKERLLDSDGGVRRFVRIYVNEEDIRFLDEQKTRLQPGDTVAIVPAIAGG